MNLLLLMILFQQPIFAPAEIKVAPVAAKSPFYVCFFTAKWCAPCRRFKNSREYKEIEKNYRIRVIDIDSKEAEDRPWVGKVSSVPSFWLCRETEKGKGEVVHRFVGSVILSELKSREIGVTK